MRESARKCEKKSEDRTAVYVKTTTRDEFIKRERERETRILESEIKRRFNSP